MLTERWLTAAISDDTVVADLLLRLKNSSSLYFNNIPPSWGLRQPRTRPPSSLSPPPPSSYKSSDTRHSPTTPLSWTPSKYSSSPYLHHPPSDRLRSKVSAASDTPTTSSKRSKRNKSFAQLKDEENSLLKERTFLEKELAILRVTLIEQRSVNEKLKRIKVDLQVEPRIKSEANHPIPPEQNTFSGGTCEATTSSASRQVKNKDVSEHSSPAQNSGSSQEPVFVLPDLNVVPDEDCGVVAIT